MSPNWVQTSINITVLSREGQLHVYGDRISYTNIESCLFPGRPADDSVPRLYVPDQFPEIESQWKFPSKRTSVFFQIVTCRDCRLFKEATMIVRNFFLETECA